jgi:hypothetical protein
MMDLFCHPENFYMSVEVFRMTCIAQSAILSASFDNPSTAEYTALVRAIIL